MLTGVNSHNSEEQKALSDSRAGSSDVLSELDIWFTEQNARNTLSGKFI